MKSVMDAKRPNRPSSSKIEQPSSAKRVSMALISVPTFSGSGKVWTSVSYSNALGIPWLSISKDTEIRSKKTPFSAKVRRMGSVILH